MKKIIIGILLAFLLIGCTNEIDAHRALHAQGFTNIKITGYDLYACSEDDFYHTGFVATNSNGYAVTGTVCSGLLFKNATIRY